MSYSARECNLLVSLYRHLTDWKFITWCNWILLKPFLESFFKLTGVAICFSHDILTLYCVNFLLQNDINQFFFPQDTPHSHISNKLWHRFQFFYTSIIEFEAFAYFITSNHTPVSLRTHDKGEMACKMASTSNKFVVWVTHDCIHI